LRKVLWPVFVYSFLDLVKNNYQYDAKKFMQEHKGRFENVRAEEIRILSLITTPKQLEEDRIAQLYLNPSVDTAGDSKYIIPLNQFVQGSLLNFLERDNDPCGRIVFYIFNTYCKVKEVERGPLEPFSFEAIFRRTHNVELDEADVLEGISGLITT
jgi:transcription initiation factor TFIID subunit 5